MKPRKILPLILLLLSIIVISCEKDSNNKNSVYIAGQIINPSSEFVIISKNSKDLDTLYLDKNDEFKGTVQLNEPGLYIFKHPPENQVMYLEPGDSTLVWINTLAFDESINFSGRGSEKNNFLSQLYLQNQQNNDLVLSYFKLIPEKFAQKTDSILKVRKIQLDQLRKRYEFSEEFYDLASSSINYEFYDLRERYAFLIKKYNPDFSKNLPEDFHNYRSQIDFEDKKMKDNYVYLNLIDDYIRTKSLEYCDEHHNGEKKCYDLHSYENIKRRILLLDSIVEDPIVKNNFLDRYAAQGIIHANNTKDLKDILSILASIDYKSPRKEDIKQMAMIQNSLLPGKNLGDLELINLENDTLKLKNLSDKLTITYPWSLDSPDHFKWQHNIIKELRLKYPEINFIGINVDKGQDELWRKVVDQHKYQRKNEFKLATISLNPDLLQNYLTKLILIDKHGTIIKGDVLLASPNYEEEIKKFLDNYLYK